MASTPRTPRNGGRNKRQLPVTPGDDRYRHDHSPGTRSVTFNKQTIETSVGGTQSIGNIRRDLNSSVSSCSTVTVSDTTTETTTTSDSLNLTNVSCLVAENKSNEDTINRSEILDTLDVNGSTTLLSIHLKKSPAWCRNDDNKENFPSPVRDLRRNTYESRGELCSPSSNSMRTPNRRYTLDDKIMTPECYSHVHMGEIDIPRFDLAYDNDNIEISEEDSKSSVTVAVRVRPFTQRYSIR